MKIIFVRKENKNNTTRIHGTLVNVLKTDRKENKLFNKVIFVFFAHKNILVAS